MGEQYLELGGVLKLVEQLAASRHFSVNYSMFDASLVEDRGEPFDGVAIGDVDDDLTLVLVDEIDERAVAWHVLVGVEHRDRPDWVRVDPSTADLQQLTHGHC